MTTKSYKFTFSRDTGALTSNPREACRFSREQIKKLRILNKGPASLVQAASDALLAEIQKLEFEQGKSAEDATRYCLAKHPLKDYFALGRLDPAPDALFADFCQIEVAND